MTDTDKDFLASYPKINGLYIRDDKGKFVFGQFARPEFEWLYGMEWLWTEKVDGTNIRLGYDASASFRGNEVAYIAGRTDNAQIPPKLLEALVELQQNIPWEKHFDGPVTLYGEGYGPKIQSGGKYRDTPGFVLFDVLLSKVCPVHRDLLNASIPSGLTMPEGSASLVTTPTSESETPSGPNEPVNRPASAATLPKQSSITVNVVEKATSAESSGSTPLNTKNCSPNKEVSVNSAANLSRRLEEEAPRSLSPSTTVTEPTEFAGSFVKGVTSESTKLSQQKDGSTPSLCTCRNWWLEYGDVEDVGRKLGIPVVPLLFKGPINRAENTVINPTFKSAWGEFTPEGVVGRPPTVLFNKKGERVLCKVKVKDYTRD